MELIKFKEYLMTIVNELSIKLNEIETEISSLPPIKEFDITKYGSKEYFIKLYLSKQPRHLFNIHLKPSENILRQFVYTRVKNDLVATKNELYKQISELKNTISSIDKNGEIVGEVYPLDNTIKELINYSIKNQIPNEVFFNLLAKLVHYINKNPHNIKRTILSDINVYLSNGNLVNFDAPKDNFLFSLKKLFLIINVDQSNQQIKEFLTNLYNDLTKEPNKQEKKGQISQIEEYIKDGKIIKLPVDQKKFYRLLKDSELPEETKKEYEEKMKQAMSRVEKQKKRKQNLKVLHKYLLEEDLNTMNEAEKLLLNLEDITLASIISRHYEEIISLCNYIELIAGSYEEQISLEILTQKLSSLKIIINNIKNPQKPTSKSFYFITNKFNIPIILSQLELIDITQYEEIYVLLYNLANDMIKGTKVKEINGIEIYHLYGENIQITYTKHRDEIIIASIKTTSEIYSSSNKDLSAKEIEKVVRLHQTPKNEKIKSLHSIYECLIANQLDLRKNSPKLTFHLPTE